MRKIPEDTNYFKYHQSNPKNKNASDCVIRALSLAMNKSWEEVFEDLCKLSLKYKLMPNDRALYEKYLKAEGWLKQKQPRNEDNKLYKVFKFLETTEYDLNFSKHSIIAHVGIRHIACIKDYKVWDSWNSSTQTMGIYWIKS